MKNLVQLRDDGMTQTIIRVSELRDGVPEGFIEVTDEEVRALKVGRVFSRLKESSESRTIRPKGP